MSPAPARKRFRVKGPPVVETNEWDLLKKMRTSDEWRRGNLVNELTTAGIERTLIATKQRVCSELRVIYLGKVAEAEGRSVLEAFLEAEKEDPAIFRRKNKASAVKSLDKLSW